MINICPDTLTDVGKRILTTISNYIIEKQTIDDLDEEQTMQSTFLHGHFTMLPDEPHADPEIGADTRTKVKSKFVREIFIGVKFFFLCSARVNQSDDQSDYWFKRKFKFIIHFDLQFDSKGNTTRSRFH